jgi:hypothetical protein
LCTKKKREKGKGKKEKKKKKNGKYGESGNLRKEGWTYLGTQAVRSSDNCCAEPGSDRTVASRWRTLKNLVCSPLLLPNASFVLLVREIKLCTCTKRDARKEESSF